MADITKCTNEECPLRISCYRWTATNSEINQWYSKFEFFEVEISGEIEYGCVHIIEK